MYIADTLSRAYLKETLPSEEVKSLELVDHIENLRVSPSRLARMGKNQPVIQFVLIFDESFYKAGPVTFASANLFCALSSSFVVS